MKFTHENLSNQVYNNYPAMKNDPTPLLCIHREWRSIPSMQYDVTNPMKV